MVVEEVQDLHIISGGETVAGEVGLPHPIGQLGLDRR
jgi:hypothetical protein